MFQGVGMVNVGGGYGTGTFIGTGNGFAWGITAKHVISTGETGTFTFESGASYAITQATGFVGTDISIFRMSSFASGVSTPGLNTSATFTVGTNLDCAGYGGHGAEGSLGGNWIYDNKRRGMQTKLDSMGTYTISGETYTAIVDRFDRPTDPNVRPIEGFGAPGDSGSALIDPNGVILGVLSGGQFEAYGNKNWYAALTGSVTSQIYNITGITPVPEPTPLIAVGLGGLLLRRRARRAPKA